MIATVMRPNSINREQSRQDVYTFDECPLTTAFHLYRSHACKMGFKFVQRGVIVNIQQYNALNASSKGYINDYWVVEGVRTIESVSGLASSFEIITKESFGRGTCRRVFVLGATQISAGRMTNFEVCSGKKTDSTDCALHQSIRC